MWQTVSDKHLISAFTQKKTKKQNIHHCHTLLSAPVHTNYMRNIQPTSEPILVCLLSFEAAKRQGVCPAAQRGHFHLNRGPWVPSGVTLATVKTIVPAVTVCV